MFLFQTLQVSLDKKTKSLSIFLKSNHIDFQLIDELEKIFSWATEHLEIQSILLTSEQDFFANGFKIEEWHGQSFEDIKLYVRKIQKFIYSMFFLPQIIVINLKNGANGVGIELAIPADIRICSNIAKFKLNHLELGLIPVCGGVGFLSSIISPSFVKNWLFSGKSFTAMDLLQCGYIHEIYDVRENDQSERILMETLKQAPIARIQAKKQFLELILPNLEKSMNIEYQSFLPILYIEDWKKIDNKLKDGSRAFCSPKDLKSKLKNFNDYDLNNSKIN